MKLIHYLLDSSETRHTGHDKQCYNSDEKGGKNGGRGKMSGRNGQATAAMGNNGTPIT